MDLVGSPPRLVDTSFLLQTLRRIDPQRRGQLRQFYRRPHRKPTS